MTREAHHQALARVAMLEGHIECLHHSTSHWQHWNWETLSATSAWRADSAQGVGGALGVEGGVGVRQGERLCWRVQAVGGPLPPAQYEPGNRQTPQPSATHEAEELPQPSVARDDRSPLKTQVWTLAQR